MMLIFVPFRSVGRPSGTTIVEPASIAPGVASWARATCSCAESMMPTMGALKPRAAGAGCRGGRPARRGSPRVIE